jgi:hypothetical protein
VTVKFQKQPKPKQSDAVYIRVPDDLRDWIVTQATKENRTLSNMAAQLLAEARQHRLEKNHAA